MTKKRRSPVDLVKESTGNKNVKWLDTLSKSDRDYVEAVADTMRACPDAAPYIVAGKLKIVLGSESHISTIVRTLKELVSDKEKK